jgi:hypothetical protein
MSECKWIKGAGKYCDVRHERRGDWLKNGDWVLVISY